MHPEFGISQHIFQGAGCISKLSEIIRYENWKRILLICGPTLYKSDVVKTVIDGITEAGATFKVFTNVRPNPEVETIEREAIPMAISCNADAIVAIGGGSTLDTAKGTAAVGKSGRHVLDFMIGKMKTNEHLEHETLPIVAIPTTAGTGSEVCNKAVVSDGSGIKQVLAHNSILPVYALLDPEMLRTLPFGVAAATAMDTFVQALETLTNRNAHDFTHTQSLRSLELVGRSIRQFVANPADSEPANNMSLACMYAGFSLGLANIGQDHIITHPMSESPFYMPHGDACAMVLPAVIEYNGLACKDLYNKAYNALTGKHVQLHRFEVQQLIDWVVELNSDLHIADDRSFADWGFNDETLEIMLNHPIIQGSVKNNSQADITEHPRLTNIDDYCAIIKRVAIYSEAQAEGAKMRQMRV